MRSIALVAIQSVRFPSAFLRIDGSGVTQSSAGGSGTVNCQFYGANQLPSPNIGNAEVFELIPIPQVPNGGWAIRSVNFPAAFLRIDGSNVTQFEGGGSGTVNCQYYASGAYPKGADYETLIFSLVILGGSNAYSIRSGAFQSAYLRMDGSNVVQPQGNGSGVVNCQYYPYPSSPQNPNSYELFYIHTLPSFGGLF